MTFRPVRYRAVAPRRTATVFPAEECRDWQRIRGRQSARQTAREKWSANQQEVDRSSPAPPTSPLDRCRREEESGLTVARGRAVRACRQRRGAAPPAPLLLV